MLVKDVHGNMKNPTEAPAQTYRVELKDSFQSGKKTITVNGVEVVN